MPCTNTRPNIPQDVYFTIIYIPIHTIIPVIIAAGANGILLSELIKIAKFEWLNSRNITAQYIVRMSLVGKNAFDSIITNRLFP